MRSRPVVIRRDRVVTAVLILVLVGAGAIVALPRAAVPVAVVPSEVPSATPVPPAVYREGVVGVPVSITPVTARTRSERTLVGLIFSGLVKLGPGSTLEPDLASSWTVDQAGQIWTVTLRADATWQDGAPVVAEDVVYTVNALKDPAAAGGMAASWAEVTATAIDNHTVRLMLASPIGGFLAALTQPLLPSHLLSDVPMADLATSKYAAKPVGSGPYALTTIDATHAVLERVADRGSGGPPASSSPGASPEASPSSSSGTSPQAPASSSPAASSPATSPTPGVAAAGRPVDQIDVGFYDTEATLAAAFKAGSVDGAAGLTGPVVADFGTLPGVEVLRYPTTALSAVLLNLRPTHPELRDATVRRALLAGIDRAALAGTVLGANAEAADALVPPLSWASNPAAGSVPYDPAAAAKALAKAGWKKVGGHWAAPKSKTAYELQLLTVPADANPHLAAIAAALRDGWTALGFKTSVTELAGSELATRLRSGAFTAALLDISSGLEPDLYPLLDSSQVRAGGSNLAGYQDPALDALLEAARAPGAQDQRTAAWTALLAGLAARLPVLPLAWTDEVMVVRGVSGVTPRLIVHTGDRFWDVLAWRLAASQ